MYLKNIFMKCNCDCLPHGGNSELFCTVISKTALSGFKLSTWNTPSLQSFCNTYTKYLYCTCKQLCHLRAVQTDREHYNVYWNSRTDTQPVKQIQG